MAAGPGPVPVEVDDLPEGWEAFATNDGSTYFCFPQVYYYCRALDQVTWTRPSPEDAQDPFVGETINGKPPYQKGDEFIPAPPPPKPYNGPLADANYKASNEDPEDVFQPDEDMLEACVECNIDKLKSAVEDGADVSLPNQPWQNTPLHLANCPYFWDSDLMAKEKALRFEISQYLVRQGADIDVENIFHCKPIDLAIFHGYEGTVRFLEEEGSKPSIFGAAYQGDLERVKELLEEGVDIDLKGRYRRTAFAEAHLRGHFAVEAFLVQQGCSREIPHPEHLKFNPGGAAIPRGGVVPKREKQYLREEDAEWYDDMMEKRFPGYMEKFMKVDLCDVKMLEDVLAGVKECDAVLHFAGYKSVGESMQKPDMYWDNNVGGFVNLMHLLEKYQVSNRVLLSSSCTVYKPSSEKISEDSELQPTCPYGDTKLKQEQILQCKIEDGRNWNGCALRYFNPAGAHNSGLLGEVPHALSPCMFIPRLGQIALGQRPNLEIFGKDYDTVDGTATRDYLHIEDVAEAHVAALEHLKNSQGFDAFNLGTGHGHTVLEVLSAFETVCGRKLPHIFSERRDGDAPFAVANPSRAHLVLGWRAHRSLSEILASHWEFVQQNPDGFD